MAHKVFVGWDRKNCLAYDVCVRSMLAHATCSLDIFPLKEWELRYRKLYWRSYIVDPDGQMVDRTDNSRFSTEFAFTRFLVPRLVEYKDEWVLFIDSDMLFRADISELFALADNQYAVMCVKHKHKPFEDRKMFGLRQTFYLRKNWSSLMLLNPSRCQRLTLYAVNNLSGEALHAMRWVEDHEIGAIPLDWNYLVGYTDPLAVPNPKVVHFTLGTPDMPECEESEYAEEWREFSRTCSLPHGAREIVYRV